MRKIKILGLFVILVVGLSLALTAKSHAESATADVIILVCDRFGGFEESTSDNMSTAGGAGVEDFAASADACNDDGDTCGGCLASLLASTNKCKYDTTYTTNPPDDPTGKEKLVTVICNP